MSIHTIRPVPAGGLTRRDALRMAVAGSVALGTTAGARTAFATTAPLKGNLKHSVARWTFPQLSLAQLCATVKDIGFAAIDLVGPEDWRTLKAHGVY
ncbi:hydroxypyruvate isomerase, partial [bacterium M00.F.Ca.ET.221.01.1.1]